MSTQSMLALLDSDHAAGLRAAADRVERDAEIAILDTTRAWLAATVRHWRGVADRHRPWHNARNLCQRDSDPYPCPDLVETLDDAKAYLGGLQ